MTLRMGYQSRTNIGKDEKGDLVADSHSILARFRKHFSKILMYMGLAVVGTQKYTQQSHWCLSRVPLRLRWLLKS